MEDALCDVLCTVPDPMSVLLTRGLEGGLAEEPEELVGPLWGVEGGRHEEKVGVGRKEGRRKEGGG